MDLDKIKNLIKKDGGKFIIVEDGEPILVVMSFKDYENIINGYKNNPFERADSMVDQEKETKEFEQGLGSLEEQEEIDEEMEPWQTIDKQEVEERYPWQGLGDETAEKQENELEKKEKEEEGSEERKNFMDMPIQAEDEETELDDLPVR